MKNIFIYLSFALCIIVITEISNNYYYIHYDKIAQDYQETIDQDTSGLYNERNIYVEIRDMSSFKLKTFIANVFVLILNGVVMFFFIKRFRPTKAYILTSLFTFTIIIIMGMKTMITFLTSIDWVYTYIESRIGIWIALFLINYAIIKARKSLYKCLFFISALAAYFLTASFFMKPEYLNTLEISLISISVSSYIIALIIYRKDIRTSK